MDLNGAPWFVAADVCRALDLIHVSNATKPLRSDEKQTATRMNCVHLFTGDRGLTKAPSLTLISESGLYKLVLRSDKAEARAFQDWVTRSVLPAIRKDGAYIMGEEKLRSGEMSDDEFVLKAMVANRTYAEATPRIARTHAAALTGDCSFANMTFPYIGERFGMLCGGVRRAGASFVLLVALAACQTGAQRQAAVIVDVVSTANTSLNNCIDEFRERPDHAPVLRRTAKPPSSYARPLLERLGDRDKINDEDARIIVERYDANVRCQTEWIASVSPVAPRLADLRTQMITDIGQIQLRLLRREITWGEANQQTDSVTDTADKRYRRVVLEMSHELDNQHATETARRQAAFATMAAGMQQMSTQMQMQQQQNQPVHSVINRPVTTNCRRIGNSISCVSN